MRRRSAPGGEQVRGCERVPTGICRASGGLAFTLRAPFAQEPINVPAELGECLKTVAACIELPRTGLARSYARRPRGKALNSGLWLGGNGPESSARQQQDYHGEPERHSQQEPHGFRGSPSQTVVPIGVTRSTSLAGSNDAAAGNMGERRGRQSSKCRLATQRQHAFARRLVVCRRLGFFHGRDIVRRRSWAGNGALSARAPSRQVDDFQRSIGRPGIALHASRHPPVLLARTVHADCRLCKLARGRR